MRSEEDKKKSQLLNDSYICASIAIPVNSVARGKSHVKKETARVEREARETQAHNNVGVAPQPLAIGQDATLWSSRNI